MTPFPSVTQLAIGVKTCCQEMPYPYSPLFVCSHPWVTTYCFWLGCIFVSIVTSHQITLNGLPPVRGAECPLTTIFNLVLYSKQMNWQEVLLLDVYSRQYELQLVAEEMGFGQGWNYSSYTPSPHPLLKRYILFSTTNLSPTHPVTITKKF